MAGMGKKAVMASMLSALLASNYGSRSMSVRRSEPAWQHGVGPSQPKRRKLRRGVARSRRGHRK